MVRPGGSRPRAGKKSRGVLYSSGHSLRLRGSRSTAQETEHDEASLSAYPAPTASLGTCRRRLDDRRDARVWQHRRPDPRRAHRDDLGRARRLRRPGERARGARLEGRSDERLGGRNGRGRDRRSVHDGPLGPAGQLLPHRRRPRCDPGARGQRASRRRMGRLRLGRASAAAAGFRRRRSTRVVLELRLERQRGLRLRSRDPASGHHQRLGRQQSPARGDRGLRRLRRQERKRQARSRR